MPSSRASGGRTWPCRSNASRRSDLAAPHRSSGSGSARPSDPSTRRLGCSEGSKAGCPGRVTIVDAGRTQGARARRGGHRPRDPAPRRAGRSTPRPRSPGLGPECLAGDAARGCSSSSSAHRSTIVFVNSRRLAEGLARPAQRSIAANDRGGSGAGRDNGGDNRGDGSNRRETEGHRERGESGGERGRGRPPLEVALAHHGSLAREKRTGDRGSD